MEAVAYKCESWQTGDGDTLNERSGLDWSWICFYYMTKLGLHCFHKNNLKHKKILKLLSYINKLL